MPKKKPRRIDDATRAAIWRERRSGATYRVISDRLGVALGTVSAVLREPESAEQVVVVASEPAGPDAGSLPTIDDLRAYLGSQVRDLRHDVATATDPAARAAANRNLVAAQLLLARVTPRPSEKEREGVYVTHEEMNEAAARGRKRWHDLADRLVEVSKSPLADRIAMLLRPPKDEG